MAKSQDKNTKVHSGGVHNLNYHLVWTPKRRASVLVGLIAEDLEAIIREQAVNLGVSIESLEIMPDYVHVFVSAKPKVSPHQIVKRFKGSSSGVLRRRYPQLMRLPALWSSSYYAGSVGNASESVVKHYIESQKSK
jgi:putative transposase